MSRKPCFFSSDLHGSPPRYRALLQAMEEEGPELVFLGGDLFPSPFARWDPVEEEHGESFAAFLMEELRRLRARMGARYPQILVILGNDDLAAEEETIREGEEDGLWRYLEGKRHEVGDLTVFGYGFVPPTPFLWKDRERYDVSRYVPPGCVSPEEGWRTKEVSDHEVRYGTIKADLDLLAGEEDLSRSIFLFHTPPHETKLDRAALDGKMVDHVPLDLHVGSIAVQRFIADRQPLLTLHGHIHESARLTGDWRDKIGRTHLFTGAHDGPELALVRFDPKDLQDATRSLI